MSKPNWLALLEKICRIDSRSEAGAAGTIQVSEELAQILSVDGFELSWITPSPTEGVRGRHLCAIRKGSSGKRLVLLGHVDTILSPEEAPFRFDSDTGHVFGSGTCDMKGGCVMILAALREALESSAVRDAELTVLFNCSEEVASPSFASLAQEYAKGATACLVFESARVGPDGIHHFLDHRKGACRLMLRCFGRAAHSGADHAHGVSAIRELARKIEILESLTDYSRDLTVNVGVIKGGSVANQVPDEASALIDMRAYDQSLLNEMREKIHRLCSEPTVRNVLDNTPTRLEVIDLSSFPAWSQRKESTVLAKRYIELAKNRGFVAEVVGSGGGSDASFLAHLAPTLDGLGILGGNMHSPDEWADWKSFASRSSAAADFITELCEK